MRKLQGKDDNVQEEGMQMCLKEQVSGYRGGVQKGELWCEVGNEWGGKVLKGFGKGMMMNWIMYRTYDD